MTGLHVSTLAYSVYTVLQKCGPVTADQAHEQLRNFWRSDVERGEVLAGMAHLTDLGFAREEDGALRALHTLPSGRPRNIRRAKALTELVLV